jgi:hypothetical protein
MFKNKVLYISLTGMTEPLGRSQVLEYLFDLSKEYEYYLISFERASDLNNIDEIKELLKDYNIKWSYLIYSNKYGVFSTIFQIFQVIFLGLNIAKKNKINIIHARSFIPTTIGLIIKKFTKAKLLFDIRGFAIDEKIDSGRLNTSSFLFNILKRWDNYLYKKSDHIVTLTKNAKTVLITKLDITEEKITIIPTCTNKNIFKVISEEEKQDFKKYQGFDINDIILIHTGTVLNRYDFDKEIELFKHLNSLNKNFKFLILNKGEHNYIKSRFDTFGIDSNNYKIISVIFDNVYKYLNIANFSLFFIPPSFAKQAMAPTKFAENIACHLPSITNIGVGDMEYYMNQYDVGHIVDLNNFDNKKICNMILDSINKKYSDKVFDELYEKFFNKDSAVLRYQSIYTLLNNK